MYYCLWTYCCCFFFEIKAAYKAAATAESKGDSKLRKEFLTEGEKYVDKALAVNPESGDTHEW